MTEGGAPIGRALSSSVYWDGMTDQISWKVLVRRIRWSAHRTMSHCYFSWLSPATAIRRRHLVRFWRRWQHLVSSPSSSIQRWLSYGTRRTEKLRFPQKAEDFIQFHVSAGGTAGEQRPLFLQLDLRWSGSVTTYHYFLLLSQTYVLGNVRSELFFVYGCRLFHFYVVFVFYSRHLYFYLFYLISKGIFHIGGLVSKMHISVYVLFTEWKCFCFLFFLHLLSTILGLWIFNAYFKHFITECEWFKFCC